jgi:uncharacterized DUF497 family protein
MRITFDPVKREWTLRQRGLDFVDATAVFAGPTFTFEDDRLDYPEVRFVTVGLLAGRMIVLVWTPDPSVVDDESRRVISMRKANAREQRRLGQRLGQAGRNQR